MGESAFGSGGFAVGELRGMEYALGGGVWVFVPTSGWGLDGPVYGRGFADALLEEYGRTGRM